MIESSLLTMKVADLIPYDNNPRVIPQAAIDAVRESFKQCAPLDPIEVDENNVILSGHTRRLAAMAEGIKEIRVIRWTGLTEEQKIKYRLLANKTGEKSMWEPDKLEEELEKVDFDGFDFGFSEDLMQELEGEAENPYSPIARYHGQIYNLPINMNTLHQLYGVITPGEAKAMLAEDTIPCEDPENLKDYILSVAGRRVYETLIQGYTEKQWGKKCEDLPKEIMRRIPIRFTYDNNYYDAKYQGCPPHGYTPIFEKMLGKCELILDADFVANRWEFQSLARKTIYTGALDALFGFCKGRLEYRSLRFQHEFYRQNNVQGVAVVNYTDRETPYTRSIEHKHFNFGDDLDFTIVTKEYPVVHPTEDDEPFYSVNDPKNNALHETYAKLAQEQGIVVAGRLGQFRYFDMQDTIKVAMSTAKLLLMGA